MQGDFKFRRLRPLLVYSKFSLFARTIEVEVFCMFDNSCGLRGGAKIKKIINKYRSGYSRFLLENWFSWNTTVRLD